jgi:hypothetical protein
MSAHQMADVTLQSGHLRKLALRSASEHRFCRVHTRERFDQALGCAYCTRQEFSVFVSTRRQGKYGETVAARFDRADQGYAMRTMIEIDDNEIQFASIPRDNSQCITESARCGRCHSGFYSTAASPIRTAARNSSSSNGLMKNADAPALKAVARTRESSFPVKMMTRVDGEMSRSRDCTSRPFMAGIQTSITATGGR